MRNRLSNIGSAVVDGITILVFIVLAWVGFTTGLSALIDAFWNLIF